MTRFLVNSLKLITLIFLGCLGVAQANVAVNCPDCDVVVEPGDNPTELTCDGGAKEFVYYVTNNSPQDQEFDFTLTNLEGVDAFADVKIKSTDCSNASIDTDSSGGSAEVKVGKTCSVKVEVTPIEGECEGCINWEILFDFNNPKYIDQSLPIEACVLPPPPPPGPITVSEPSVPTQEFCGEDTKVREFEFIIKNENESTQSFDFFLEYESDLIEYTIVDATEGCEINADNISGNGELEPGKTCTVTVHQEIVGECNQQCTDVDWIFKMEPDSDEIPEVEYEFETCFKQKPPSEGITVTDPDVPTQMQCQADGVEIPFIIRNFNEESQKFTFEVVEVADPNDLVDFEITNVTTGCSTVSQTAGEGELSSGGSCTVTVTETPTDIEACQAGCVDWKFIMLPENDDIPSVEYTYTTCFNPPPPPVDCDDDPENDKCPQPSDTCEGSEYGNIPGIASKYAIFSGEDITVKDNGPGPVVTKFCNGKAGAVGTNELSLGNTDGQYVGTTPQIGCVAGEIDDNNAENVAQCVCGAADSYITAMENAGCINDFSGSDLGSGVQSIENGNYYCFNGNTDLDGTLTLKGSDNYYFFINGNFTVKSNGKVVLEDGLSPDQINWIIVDGNSFTEQVIPNPEPNQDTFFVGNVYVKSDSPSENVININRGNGVNKGRYYTCSGEISLSKAYVVKP